MFNILIVVMVSQLYTYVLTHQKVDIKNVQFFYINYIPIKSTQKKDKELGNMTQRPSKDLWPLMTSFALTFLKRE